MIEWLPSIAGVLTAGLAHFGRSHVFVCGLLAVVACEVWKDGSLAPGEPLALVLCALAIAPVIAGPYGRCWLAVAVASALAPDSDLDASVKLSLFGVGVVGVIASNSALDAEKPTARLALVIAAWLASMLLVELVIPGDVRGGPVDDLAASRGRVPLAFAFVCGLFLWPCHTVLLAACRSGSAATPVVLPLLGLVTFSELQVDPLIRDALVGELDVLFVPLGIATLCWASFLAIIARDTRLMLVAAQIGLAGWSVALWFEDAASGRLLWATAAVSSTVMGAVIARLEERYETRELGSLRGLAKRHPTAAVVIGFSGIVLAKAAVGPLAMTRGLLVVGEQRPLAVVAVLLASLAYAAALARGLNTMLFGTPSFPVSASGRDENVSVRHRPMVGPVTLIAWGVPLVFVIVVSVLPYNSAQTKSDLETPAATVGDVSSPGV